MTRRTIICALAVLALVAAPQALARVQVDLGLTGQRVEEGWTAMTETDTIQLSDTFDDAFTLSLTTLLGGVEWRDRGDYEGPQPVRVLEDGAKKADDIIFFELQNLAAGTYFIRFYSIDMLDTGLPENRGLYTVKLNDADGAGQVIQSERATATQGYPEEAGTLGFTFRSDGAAAVSIDFEAISGETWINGFEIDLVSNALPKTGVAPTQVVFGDLSLGETTEQVVTVRNDGDPGSELELTGLDTTGLEAPFSISDEPTYPVALAFGDAAEITVACTPETLTTEEGLFKVLTMEGDTAVETTVTLSSSGVGRAFGYVPNVTAYSDIAASMGNPMDVVADSYMREVPGGFVIGTKDAIIGHEGNWAVGQIDGAWIEFDLGEVLPLAEMAIWNHNSNAGYGVGMRSVRIEKSTDGAGWSNLAAGDYILARANGDPNQPRTDLIDCGGVDARYVRVTVTGEQYVGNYATLGDTQCGLGCVRFYRADRPDFTPDPATVDFGLGEIFSSKQIDLTIGNKGEGTVNLQTLEFVGEPGPFSLENAPAAPKAYGAGETDDIAVVFRPTEYGEYAAQLRLIADDGSSLNSYVIDVTGSALMYERGFIRNPVGTPVSEGGYLFINIYNNSGITEIPDDGLHKGTKAALHNASKHDMWQADGGTAADWWFEFDLGSIVELDEVWLWNFNRDTCCLQRALRWCVVSYRETQSQDWTVLGTYEMDGPGPGTAGMPATNINVDNDGDKTNNPPLQFNGASCRYVRFESIGDDTGQWGEPHDASFSEIRFYASSYPEIGVEPRVIDFGPVAVGGAADEEITVTNTGNGPLLVSSMLFDSEVPFTVSPENLNVPAGESATVTVTFAPDTAGDYLNKTLNVVNSDDANSLVKVSVSATSYEAGTADIFLRPPALVFGELYTNNPPKSLDLVIENRGDTTLDVTSVLFEGDAGPFSFADPGSFGIEPFGEFVLPVTCSVTEAGNFTADVVITSSDPDEDIVTLPLTATGAAAPPASANPAAWMLFY